LINLVYTELLKLKRSMMFLMSLIGATAAPLIVFIGFLGTRARHPGIPIQFQEYFSETSFGIVLLTGVPLYGVITAYLINREYTENTLKNLLTIPVSRIDYILSKLILLFLWIMTLTLISWVSAIIFGLVGQFVDLNSNVLLSSFYEFMIGGSLLFVLTPSMILVTLLFKNFLPTVVFTIVITMGNLMVASSEYRALYPWSAVYVIAKNGFLPEYPPEYSFYSIAIVSVLGLIATLIYFVKTDVHYDRIVVALKLVPEGRGILARYLTRHTNNYNSTKGSK
jgi:bacitracin transport system permease protein